MLENKESEETQIVERSDIKSRVFFNTFGTYILIEGKSWRKGRDIRERTEQVAEIVGRGLGVHCLENMEGSLSQKEAHSL